MAGYKEIKGFHVQTRSEDPTPYAQALADNPYVGAWSSGGNLNTGRGGLGGAGLQTAALAFAGNKNNPPAPFTGETEQYNGSSWTEVADLNTSRYEVGGAGATYSAALCFGGLSPPNALAVTENWNGSAWTEVGDLNSGRGYLGSAGTNTAALAIAGDPGAQAIVESWDGSS